MSYDLTACFVDPLHIKEHNVFPDTSGAYIFTMPSQFFKNILKISGNNHAIETSTYGGQKIVVHVLRCVKAKLSPR